jgi:uncharacterized protein
MHMQWLNEPARWSEEDGSLTVTADPDTDFWRVTGYGYCRDTGHLYGERLDGDFQLSMRVRGRYAAQYDQAGAMVRVDERRWLKTGIEYFDGRMRLSTVITLDYSSWALADVPAGASELSLLLARNGDAIEVRYSFDGADQQLAGVAYMPPDEAVLAGPMCAAPEGTGFDVTFRDLVIVKG